MTAVIEAKGIEKIFHAGSDFLGRRHRLHAVSDVSLTLYEGEILTLVGESGCGKSTLGHLMLNLLEPTAGAVLYRGEPIAHRSGDKWRALRRELQLVFQDAGGALDPRLKVGDQIREPLDIHGIGTPERRREKVAEICEAVRLRSELLDRHPHELSGGQLQRVVIARSLILEPKVLVCDEPVAALDVSIRAQIINLLLDLKGAFGLSYLFISHDLSLVRHISDRMAVMYLGRIVEIGDAEQLFEAPRHPYTRALISAIPVPDPTAKRQRILLEGDPPSPLNPPRGCTFHPRCPHAQPLCLEEVPPLRPIGHRRNVTCHRAEELA